MPKKTPNSKAVAANAKKAAHQADVDARQRAEEERNEVEKWQQGARGMSKKELEEERKTAQRARKAEAAALLDEEERSLMKPAKKTGPKLDPDNPLMLAAAKKKKASTVARGSDKVAAKKALKNDERSKEIEQYGKSGSNASSSVEHLAAANIDDALDLLNSTASTTVINSKNEIERHPERRVKAAYKEWEERMMPAMKKENPGLRLSQLKELLHKKWQKAPENPFNQAHISHSASKKEERDMLQQLQTETEARLRLN